MVWYDELGSRPQIPEVMTALKSLKGRGTLSQIEKKLLEIYKLPKGMIGDKDLIRDPLERLIDRGVLEYKGSKYIVVRNWPEDCSLKPQRYEGKNAKKTNRSCL